MKNIKFLVLAVSVATLAGCANGPLQTVADTNTPVDVNYTVTGASFLLGGFGTTVPLTKNLSLTAAHVAKVNWDHVVAYHPDCDIAVVEQDNSNAKLPEIGKVYVGGVTHTYGKRWDGSTYRGDGVYNSDWTFPDNEYFKTCNASITTASVREGMSGGAVTNDKGELVGIISSYGQPKQLIHADGTPTSIERVTLFTALNGVSDWLSDVVNTYEAQQTASK